MVVLDDERKRESCTHKFGNTPLLEAVQNGQDQVVSLLVKNGASLSMDNDSGSLCMAVARRDLDFLRRVLACGINPNAKNYDFRTPLHIAASEGLFSIAKLLIEAGASVLSKDRWGNTPMDDAQMGGNKDLIKLLEDASMAVTFFLLPTTEKMQRKRCLVFPFHPLKPEERSDGVVLWVPQTIGELIRTAAEHLGITEASCILSEEGGRILNIDMIGNDQKLFLVSFHKRRLDGNIIILLNNMRFYKQFDGVGVGVDSVGNVVRQNEVEVSL
ncbi:Ankyrin repeat [Dillenia turbinata]|uniref:Ankyrin repeat n=1 Tax=Dillenia turbinata TaxID=194707 RepID=A0AAN8VDJ3_9MAGN